MVYPQKPECEKGLLEPFEVQVPFTIVRRPLEWDGHVSRSVSRQAARWQELGGAA